MRKPVIVEGDLLAELMNRPPEELRSLFVHFFLQADQVESRESPFAERQVDRPSHLLVLRLRRVLSLLKYLHIVALSLQNDREEHPHGPAPNH